MTKHFRLSRAAELAVLPDVRDFIQEACAACGVSQAVIDDLKLAADEACTNIITHGYAGMDPGTLIVELRLDETQAEMRVADFGHPFEPTQAPVPDVTAPLEDRAPGGFGLYFIYSVMDSVDYTSDAVGNCLVLIKRLK